MQYTLSLPSLLECLDASRLLVLNDTDHTNTRSTNTAYYEYL